MFELHEANPISVAKMTNWCKCVYTIVYEALLHSGFAKPLYRKDFGEPCWACGVRTIYDLGASG